MRFLTPDEWRGWCRERSIPLGDDDWIRPDLKSDRSGYHVVELPYPVDSGAKVALARRLFGLIESDAEALVLLDEWDVWPSSAHLPLLSRFREAFGERRSLIDAPGQLVPISHREDGISIVALAVLFVWDCYGISASGEDAFFVSHDEYCLFASRDAHRAERVAAEFDG